MTDDLEDLPGVGPATAEQLTDAGFKHYQAIAVASPGELSRLTDVGTDTAADIIQAARKAADIGRFVGATLLARVEVEGFHDRSVLDQSRVRQVALGILQVGPARLPPASVRTTADYLPVHRTRNRHSPPWTAGSTPRGE